MIPSLLWRCSCTTEEMTPVSQQANLPSVPLQAAEQLLCEGRPVEASHVLADALAQGESPDLWNDWAAAQLSLSERAFRRALQLDQFHAQAASNLGILLFGIGNFADAVFFLERSLRGVSGLAREHVQTLLLLSATRLAGGRLPLGSDRDSVRNYVLNILEEYFIRGNRSGAVVTPQGFMPLDDVDPSWIQSMLDGSRIHDEDYLVFQAFQDPGTTILDVGAHFGYSVASIWSSGAACRVISFEPNPRFEPCLRHIATQHLGRYDYRVTALGDARGSLNFVVPVLNGYALGALATAAPSPHLPSLARNVADHFEQQCRGQLFTSFRLYSFESQVARLDDLLASEKFSFPADKIVAVKIDTEGYEAQVLSGCAELLAREKPLLLVESGHANPLVCEQLMKSGYTFASRIGRQLEPVNAPTTAINGFFFHPAHTEEYLRIGLLRP